MNLIAKTNYFICHVSIVAMSYDDLIDSSGFLETTNWLIY